MITQRERWVPLGVQNFRIVANFVRRYRTPFMKEMRDRRTLRKRGRAAPRKQSAIEIVLAMLDRSVMAGVVILGDVTLQGGTLPLHGFVDCRQAVTEQGSRRVLADPGPCQVCQVAEPRLGCHWLAAQVTFYRGSSERVKGDLGVSSGLGRMRAASG
jgi:predicted ATP-dependent Lon-type protease